MMSRQSHSDLHAEMNCETLTSLLHDLIRRGGDYRWAEIEELKLTADDSLGTTTEHRASLNEILAKIWNLVNPDSNNVPTFEKNEDDESVESSAKAFDWSINGTFSKFGNNDGNSDWECTNVVVDLLEKHGYDVMVHEWGMHNPNCIVQISRKGEILYPPQDTPFSVGYDDVFDVLPDDIANLLKTAAESDEWKQMRCIGLGSGGCDF